MERIRYRAGRVGPVLLLDDTIEACNNRDVERRNGCLARLRLQIGVPFIEMGGIFLGEVEYRSRPSVLLRSEVIEAMGAIEDMSDPHLLLKKVIEAMRSGQMALAAGYFDRLTAILGCPHFDSEDAVIEVMEEAGYGRLQMILVDTGLDMPGECEAAE